MYYADDTGPVKHGPALWDVRGKFWQRKIYYNPTVIRNKEHIEQIHTNQNMHPSHRHTHVPRQRETFLQRLYGKSFQARARPWHADTRTHGRKWAWSSKRFLTFFLQTCGCFSFGRFLPHQGNSEKSKMEDNDVVSAHIYIFAEGSRWSKSYDLLMYSSMYSFLGSLSDLRRKMYHGHGQCATEPKDGYSMAFKCNVVCM